MRKRSGFTLLEVVIAMGIFIVATIILFSLFAASDKTYQQEAELRPAQFQLQQMMDRLTREIRESSQSLVRTLTYTDLLLPTNTQTLVIFPSARDATDGFNTNNAQAVWQKVVVYCAYYDAASANAQLRRYEVYTPFDGAFLSAAATPTMNVTATNLVLGTMTIPRNSGTILSRDFDHLFQTLTPPPDNKPIYEMALVKTTPLSRQVTLKAYAIGRN